MKKIVILACVFSFFCVSIQYAQIDLGKVLKKSKKEAEKKVENKIGDKINKGVDKALDETEKGIEGKDTKDKNKEKATETKNQKTQIKQENQAKEPTDNKAKNNIIWNKYDFIPGDLVIFEDNLTGEKNGEFPSKWDMTKGTFEIANFNGENVIIFIKCNINGEGGIVPLLKNSSEDYLPEEFTVEFDAYFEKENAQYKLNLVDFKNQKKLHKASNIDNMYLRFGQNSSDGSKISGNDFPGLDKKTKPQPGWRHIAVSFNKRALKTYLDEARILNVPNIEYNPTGITLNFHNPSGTIKGYVKNFRLAKGAVPLYDKVMSDGKIVTTGIKFDVNKAVIKPESMGVINEIYKILSDNKDLRFSVEGHTDSDGDDASNQKLSEARAKSVMNMLVELGISSDRLRSTGWGESKSVSDNNTPEGKANNRRVEFIKF